MPRNPRGRAASGSQTILQTRKWACKRAPAPCPTLTAETPRGSSPSQELTPNMGLPSDGLQRFADADWVLIRSPLNTANPVTGPRWVSDSYVPRSGQSGWRAQPPVSCPLPPLPLTATRSHLLIPSKLDGLADRLCARPGNRSCKTRIICQDPPPARGFHAWPPAEHPQR